MKGEESNRVISVLLSFIVFGLGIVAIFLFLLRYMNKLPDPYAQAIQISKSISSALSSPLQYSSMIDIKYRKRDTPRILLYYERIDPPADSEWRNSWPAIFYYGGKPDVSSIRASLESLFPDPENLSINMWVSGKRLIVIPNIIASNPAMDVGKDTIAVQPGLFGKYAVYYICSPSSLCIKKDNTIRHIGVPEADMTPVVFKSYLKGCITNLAGTSQPQCSEFDRIMSLAIKTPCKGQVVFSSAMCNCTARQFPVFDENMKKIGDTVVCLPEHGYEPCILAESKCLPDVYLGEESMTNGIDIKYKDNLKTGKDYVLLEPEVVG